LLNLRVKEFAEQHYRERVLSNWKDPKAIRHFLDNEILPALGDRLLKNVTSLDVQALVCRKRDNGRNAVRHLGTRTLGDISGATSSLPIAHPRDISKTCRNCTYKGIFTGAERD